MCYEVISEVKLTKESILENLDSTIEIRIKPKGYWSETVTCWIRYTYEKVWRIDQKHSSGGRDTEEVADDYVAERNMAFAMIDLSHFIEQTFTAEFQRELADTLEAIRAKERAAFREAQRVYQIQLDEHDPAIGEEKAKNLVEAVKLNAKMEGFYWLYVVRRALADEQALKGEWYRAECNYGRVRFRFHGQNAPRPHRDTEAVSAGDLITVLAKASAKHTRMSSTPRLEEAA